MGLGTGLSFMPDIPSRHFTTPRLVRSAARRKKVDKGIIGSGLVLILSFLHCHSCL